MEINKLSLEEKIGQRFIIGVNDKNIEPVIELIKKAYIGGVVLYKKNYNNYSEMLKVIKKFKIANKNNKVPLFIAIDQEGGVVNRLPSEIHNLKSIYDISMLDNKKVKKIANIISKILVESGINMNFAPVADIYNNSMSKALYKRCFYGNCNQVSKYSLQYINACNDNNLISVIKHYPGHGATKMDSHLMIPFVFNSKDIINNHMLPFNMAILNGVDAIMVGHIIVKRLTGLLPASLSNKFLNKYLRSGNYNGLIISDEINMLKRNPIYHFNYVEMFLKSINDVILIKIKDIDDGYNIINKYKKILDNDIYVNRLDDHVGRVLSIKEKYKIDDSTTYKGINIEEVNMEIDMINNGI